MGRVLRLFGVLAGVAVIAAACQWPMVRFGPSRTGYSPGETAINPANVGQLTQQWTASLVGPGSDPVVADGHVFVTAVASPNSELYAFDPSGSTNCTATPPKTCGPQWSDPFSESFGLESTALSAPGVSNGAVWIGTCCVGEPNAANGSMNAYNESTGALVVSGGQSAGTSSPAITDKTVYASWEAGGTAVGLFSGIEALNPTTGASLFSTLDSGTPAVSNGTIFAAAGNIFNAFDATGTTNCGSPSSIFGDPSLPSSILGFSTFCTPLWSATLTGSLSTSMVPAVANGYVYIGDSSGTLSAFPAGGCGAATCAPAWTASTGSAIESSVAVTPTTVFVGSDNGTLSAFPAHGCGAATCQPLWTATTGGAVKSSASVAGALVYVGSDDGHLHAFNAFGCGQASCSPAWSTNVGAPVETSPAIANGQVFVTDTAGTLHAYGLPARTGS